MSFDFSQTYLYKMHRLTNSLDQAFDAALHRHAGIGLSQFSLLMAIRQFRSTSQVQVARFLDITPAAVSRQVDLAAKNGWIKVIEQEGDHRTKELHLTVDGKQKIQDGITGLEADVFDIFKDENRQTNLMDHIVTLQSNIDALDGK